jgi:inhibitor of KinA
MLQYIPSGDSAFTIKAGNEISEEINRTIRKLLVRIEQENIDGIVDFIPSYNELMVGYDPSIIGYQKLLAKIQSFESNIDSIELPVPSIIHIPVFYGGDFGPDLREVANHNGISEDEVILIHTSSNYLVYMLGFTPGFCYLGGMNQRIATPRKQTPRLKTPAGAVGIADKQTGIYPIESPGGWQLIGQTPLKLFNPTENPEFLISVGDYVKFKPINKTEYDAIQRAVEDNTYRVMIEVHK